MLNNTNKKIAIAPMLDWSDRHYRYFMRQITKHTIVYTEMIVADAIIHGDRDRLLAFAPDEQPVVVQLGGSDPKKLAIAAKICVDYGYLEINLNCGCPSDRVQSGKFGACLMREPSLVAACLNAMQEAVPNTPITIKQRIGLNYDYDYDYCANFVARLAASGCKSFIIHARNAVLNGLSPKANREIPPLRYDYVYRLKHDFPQLNFMLNGGIKNHNQINHHLALVDGVMLGREAYANPYLFASVDQLYFGAAHLTKSRRQIALDMLPYLKQQTEKGLRLHHITRHMLGLYSGCSKAKIWRRQLTNQLLNSNAINDYIQLVEHMDE